MHRLEPVVYDLLKLDNDELQEEMILKSEITLGHQNCLVRLFKGTDLVECVSQRRDCEWSLHIGHISLMCKNPYAIQHVYSNPRRNLQTDLMSLDKLSHDFD
jgi:hypothetical protein